VVGIGPGCVADRTLRAENAIRQSSAIFGYKRYLDLIADLIDGKQAVASGMTQETKRCRAALDCAATGEIVALVSSGDPGVYGMAGLALEMAEAEGIDVSIEIVPGVSAANAAAARLGAPLMLDYACISLSDLLVPWQTIEKRLQAVAAADLVCALYNPKSQTRIDPWEKALEIFKAHRPAQTPVGIATAVGSADERMTISTLEKLPNENVAMRSIVIIGNSSSRKSGSWLITPRGYQL